jgi:hypothetical protein
MRPAASFTKNSRSSDGLSSWCRSCFASRDRTVLIEYTCEDCGKHLIRNTPQHGKKVFDRNLCPRCVRHAVMKMHGGRTANWTGSENFAGRLIFAWKFSAARRGHEWNLTKEDLDHQFLLQGGICALSGITMIVDKASPYRPSIDRIDSGLGYEIGNFQFVCSIVNVMKNKIHEPLFLDLCASIVRFRKQSQFPVGVEEDGGKLVR